MSSSSYLNEGDVVICPTAQAGTLVQLSGSDAWVLLANGNMWLGLVNCLREPQSAEDLAACVYDVDTFINR